MARVAAGDSEQAMAALYNRYGEQLAAAGLRHVALDQLEVGSSFRDLHCAHLGHGCSFSDDGRCATLVTRCFRAEELPCQRSSSSPR